MKAAYSRVSMTQPPTVTDQAILERLIPFPKAHFLAASDPVSYTHLRAHQTDSHLVCRLLL